MQRTTINDIKTITKRDGWAKPKSAPSGVKGKISVEKFLEV